MVDEAGDGGGGSIIASGVSSHCSDSPRETKQVADTVEGVDIISSMPHEILHHILSFIPSQYAIRTSALSRGWRHVWCHTPCLDFKNINRYAISGLAKLLQNSPELKKLIAHAGRFAYTEDRDLDHYLESQGLNPGQCWRSKYEVFPTSFRFCSMISCKDATWKLMASFTEMVMRNVKTLETLVLGLECNKPEHSDARWFEELVQMLQLLSNNSNVSIVLKR